MLTGPIIPFPIYLLARKMVKIFDSISAVDGLNRQKYEQRRQQNNFVGGTSTFGLSAFCRGMGAMMCCPENSNRRVYDETSDRVGLAGAMEKIQAERSKTIDLELKKEAEMNEKIIKILLLGASDSGKSTIAKQMRILHTEGFSADERLHYKYMIHSNYIDSFQFIAKGIYILQIDVPPAERELIHTFGDSYYGQFLNLSESSDLIGIIVKFLNFKAVKQAIDRINEFYVPDNTSYLLKEAHRILHPEYNPTTEDIIHARAATKGIYEIIFQFRQFTIRLIDVGGQKTERRKWIHCFEGVAAILFIVSLSCYNQVMEEDSQRNQMADTIELFKTIYRNKFLRSSSFMIFLNKKDIFARKILYVPLQKYYPAFETKLQPNMEAADIFKEAVDFVKNMFMTVRGHDKRPLYTHTTNATDTRNVEIVFNATYDNAVTKNLKNSGVL